MALDKLPIRFSEKMLGEFSSADSVLSCLDVVWANAQIIDLVEGDTLTLGCSDRFYDFQRSKVVVVLSGRLHDAATSLTFKAGDCASAHQWFAAKLEADTDARVLLAQTCANKKQLKQLKLEQVEQDNFQQQSQTPDQEQPSYRKERKQALRLPSAGDVAELLAAFQTGLAGASQMVFSGLCDKFITDWRNTYNEESASIVRVQRLRALTARFTEQSRQALFGHELLDGQSAHQCLEAWLADEFQLDKLLADTQRRSANAINSEPVSGMVNGLSPSLLANVALFDEPVFIVAAPRSGSTMLFEALKENKDFWTIGDESHQVFESIKELHPAAHGFVSNRLTAEHLDNAIGAAIVGGFTRRLRSNQGELFTNFGVDNQPSTVRFLEKTPKNALRIPFLKALFPDAKFVFLHRQAEPNIASIINAWTSGNFVTYPRLPNWNGPPWSLLLCPDRERIDAKPLAEIAAWQWASTNQQILDDLEALNANDWCAVSYEQVLADKTSAFRTLCEFAKVPFGPRMQALAAQALPQSKYTVSAPSAEKWRQHETEIYQAMIQVGEVAQIAERLAALNAED